VRERETRRKEGKKERRKEGKIEDGRDARNG
jgi:hypothetical protein